MYHMSAQPDEAQARLTYRNGSGYSVIYARRLTLTDRALTVEGVDGDRHTFSTGADWHLKHLDGGDE